MQASASVARTVNQHHRGGIRSAPRRGIRRHRTLHRIHHPHRHGGPITVVQDAVGALDRVAEAINHFQLGHDWPPICQRATTSASIAHH
jgi:hypothetical protein